MRQTPAAHPGPGHWRHDAPPYLIAAATLAIAGSVDAAQHHHQARCGHRHDCIEAVAARSCATRHDPWHCRIWRRWQTRLDTEQHTFRIEELAAAVPAAADPPPSAAAPAASSSFDQCVAQHESNGDWHAQTGNGYSGAYQFSDATWQQVQAAMGVHWSSSAAAATPAEQTAAFDYWSARDPGAWPNTIPACGG